jgi:hypothetical protein
MAPSRKRTSAGDNVRTRAQNGIYTLVDPFDFLILDFLPEEGQMFAGLYPLGERVPNLLKKFTPDQQKVLKTSDIAARLVSLQVQGLVQVSSGGNSKNQWQRTKKGTEVLNNWKKEKK